MRDIKVDKQTVITFLKNNREKHIALFAENYKKYRELCISYLSRRLDESKLNKRFQIYDGCTPEEPSCYISQYDLAIEMLEMSVDEQVELNVQDFKKYIKDEWDWSYNFYNSSSASGIIGYSESSSSSSSCGPSGSTGCTGTTVTAGFSGNSYSLDDVDIFFRNLKKENSK